MWQVFDTRVPRLVGKASRTEDISQIGQIDSKMQWDIRRTVILLVFAAEG